RARFDPSPLWCDLSPGEWLLLKMEQNLYMSIATWLVSRQLTDSAGPWDTQLSTDEDGEYFCRVLLHSDGVRFVPGANAFYRVAGLNTVSNVGRSKRKMEGLFRSMQLHIEYLRSLDDSERARAACVKYLQNSLINLYPERPDIMEQAKQLASTLGG